MKVTFNFDRYIKDTFNVTYWQLIHIMGLISKNKSSGIDVKYLDSNIVLAVVKFKIMVDFVYYLTDDMLDNDIAYSHYSSDARSLILRNRSTYKRIYNLFEDFLKYFESYMKQCNSFDKYQSLSKR